MMELVEDKISMEDRDRARLLLWLYQYASSQPLAG